MNMGRNKLSHDLQQWIDARKRFHLSHAHVQMARELGMNPQKLGKLANHDQEPWKAPLPQFIEHLYFRRFGRERPDVVMSVEERARAKDAKRAARKEARRQARQVTSPLRQERDEAEGLDRVEVDDRQARAERACACRSRARQGTAGSSLLEHAEKGVHQAHHLGSEVIGRETKERGGPHGAHAANSAEVTVQDQQSMLRGRFADERAHRVGDLGESSLEVLQDIEEVVRVLVGAAPVEGQGLEDDVRSWAAHPDIA